MKQFIEPEDISTSYVIKKNTYLTEHRYFYIDLDGELMTLVSNIDLVDYDKKICRVFDSLNKQHEDKVNGTGESYCETNVCIIKTGHYLFTNRNSRGIIEWKLYDKLEDCKVGVYDTTICPYIKEIDRLFDQNNEEDMEEIKELIETINTFENMG